MRIHQKGKNGLFLNLFHLECSLELHKSFLKETPNIYGEKKILFRGPGCSFKQIPTLKHGINTPVAQLLGYLVAAVRCIMHHSGQEASTTGQARSLTRTGISWWHWSSPRCTCHPAPLPQLPLRKPWQGYPKLPQILTWCKAGWFQGPWLHRPAHAFPSPRTVRTVLLLSCWGKSRLN